MARPEKVLDWKIVDKLLIAGCPGTEIADRFGMHPNSFYLKVQDTHGCGFSEYCQQKHSEGNTLLREAQFNKAIEGDNSMMIWLGKNRLKQSDTPTEINVSKETLINFNALMGQISSCQSASKAACNNSNIERISALDAESDNTCGGSVS